MEMNEKPSSEESRETQSLTDGADSGKQTTEIVGTETGGENQPAGTIGIKGKKSGKFSLFSFFVGIIVTLVVLVCGVIIYLAVPYIGSTDDPLSAGSLKKLFEIVALVKSDYLEDVDGEDMTDGMYSGLMSSLGDEYAAYYTKDEIDSIKMSQAGKMKGIGISFTMDDETGYVLVEDVTEDGPADKAGLKVNDLITSIDGESTEDLSTSEVKSLIQDSDSDTVSLTVDRDGEELDFSVEKDYIENTQIVVGGMVKDSKIGYIMITSFTGLTAEQFSSVYDDLQDQGMEGLIIDLRDNGGGLVSACIDTLELFMPEGVLIYEENNKGEEKERDCEGETPIDVPLVLLVNGNTASASEMFAGAVQDNGVGVIVGTQTYGKGIEQSTWTLSDGSAVKMTTTKYYTPNHTDINGVGITPDYEVEYDADSDEDAQFNKAFEIVSEEAADSSDTAESSEVVDSSETVDSSESDG
ncbi:MAG: S41 family peptidase [Eubacteriales bacterium]|jgi:carboxyl-terminal processing protease